MPMELTAVVITATRGKAVLFDTARSIFTIGRSQLREQQAESSFDALRERPGVMVQQTNRGAGIPVIRGQVGPSNLVLIDGMRFNQATWRTGPSQYLTLLDPSSFESFEVMAGPASVRYGSGALGGVTAGIPWKMRQAAGFGARGGLRFVSQDQGLSGWTHLEGRFGSVSVAAGGAIRNHNQLRTGGGETVPLSDWTQQSAHVQARWWASSQTTLDLLLLGSQVGHGGRVDRLAQGRMRIYDNLDGFGALTLRHTGEGALKSLRVSVVAHGSRDEVARFECENKDNLSQCVDQADSAYEAVKNDGATTSFGSQLSRDRRYRDAVRTLGGLFTATWSLGKSLSLSVGAEGWYDTVLESTLDDRKQSTGWSVKSAARGNFSEDTSWLESGGFAWLDSTLWQSASGLKLTLGAGARLAHFRGNAADVPGLGEVAYSHTGVVGSGQLRLINPNRWMLYLDVSQGFRSPNVQESTVLGDTGSKFEVPNADLGPERSLSLEVGGRLSIDRVRLQVAGFVNQVSDFIGEQDLSQAEIDALGLDPADIDGQPVVKRVNRDTGLFVGAEAQLSARLDYGLTPWVRVSWTQGDINKDDGTSTPARRVNPVLGTAALRWQAPTSGFWAEIYSRFSGAQDRLHPSDQKDLRICADPNNPSKSYASGTCPGSSSWVTLNARGGWRYNRSLSIDLALTNVLDTQYRVHGSGFDAAGFGASLSMTGRY